MPRLTIWYAKDTDPARSWQYARDGVNEGYCANVRIHCPCRTEVDMLPKPSGRLVVDDAQWWREGDDLVVHQKDAFVIRDAEGRVTSVLLPIARAPVMPPGFAG